MKTYFIEIIKPNAFGPNVQYAHAYGDLDTINYIAKKAGKAIEGADGNLSLRLTEVDGIGGQEAREVVSVVANAKVVSTVLKTELTSERKAAKSAPAEPSQTRVPLDVVAEPAEDAANGDQDPEDGPTGTDVNGEYDPRAVN